MIMIMILVGLGITLVPTEVQAGADICLLGAAQCLGDASIVDWATKMIVGHLLYCINGYDFCRQYIMPYK